MSESPTKKAHHFDPLDLLVDFAIIVFLLLFIVTILACLIGPILAAVLCGIYLSPWFAFLALAEFITLPIAKLFTLILLDLTDDYSC